MDINGDISGLQLPDDIKSVLGKPEVSAALATVLEKYTSPLANKNNELLGEVKGLKSQIGEIGGIEALKEIKAMRAKAQQDTLNGNDVETIKKTYQSQLEAESSKRKSLEKRIVSTELDRVVTAAIAQHDGVPELLEHIVKGRLKTELTDDYGVRIRVLDANGAPKLLADGKEATVSDLVAEFRNTDIYGRAFKPSGRQGSGASPTKTPGLVNPFRKETASLTEQGKLVRENPAMARSLMVEAGLDPRKFNL